jgi:ABC-type branched-subunit amino acid transport system substrate-binding protein
VDSQVTSLAQSGADFVIWNVGPKQIVQAIQKSTQLGWKPQMYLPSAQSSIPAVIGPAGPGAAGARTPVYIKNPVDPTWADDPAVAEYWKIITEYGAGASPDDTFVVQGYAMGQSILAQLERLEEPTREALSSWPRTTRRNTRSRPCWRVSTSTSARSIWRTPESRSRNTTEPHGPSSSDVPGCIACDRRRCGGPRHRA